LSRRLYDKPGFPGEELVVVTSPLLRHKVVRGYSDPLNKVVKSVDGVSIKNFRHLIETLREGQNEFVTIEFVTKSTDMIVLPRRFSATLLVTSRQRLATAGGLAFP